jgi:hypothetical protein
MTTCADSKKIKILKPTTVGFVCVNAVSNRQFTSKKIKILKPTTVGFACVDTVSNRQFTSKIDNF